MGRAKANGSQQAGLKEIDWANNNYELVFGLLDQLERPENFKVLFGKKDASEVVNSRIHLIPLLTDCIFEQNTSRKSKVSIYKSIAEALFPEEFKVYADQLVSRVKTRIQMYVPLQYMEPHLAKESTLRLRNQYSNHVKRLRKTGEGIQGEGPESSTEVNELMVPACGPDYSTSLHARNIWGKISVFLSVDLRLTTRFRGHCTKVSILPHFA
jgi:hypothetical protein